MMAGAVHPQLHLARAWARMPHWKKASNPSLMNRGIGPGAGFGLGDETGRVLLH